MVLRAEPSRLLVFQVAESIANDCTTLAQTFRGPGVFARADQLVRASHSIVANIAEGCGRGSVADFRRFLLIVRSMESRTFLVLKLLTRLHAHPPPE